MTYRPAAVTCDWIVTGGMANETCCDKDATVRFDTGKPSNSYEPNPFDVCEGHVSHCKGRGWHQIEGARKQ